MDSLNPYESPNSDEIIRAEVVKNTPRIGVGEIIWRVFVVSLIVFVLLSAIGTCLREANS